MQIDRLAQLVVTVHNLHATCAFYARVRGMPIRTVGANRTAVAGGEPQLTLHAYGHAVAPKATHPRPGATDLGFVTAPPLAAVKSHLAARGVPLLCLQVPSSAAVALERYGRCIVVISI